MVLKISLPSGRHREGSKINHFDKFLFSPSKGSHRETPKIAGWIIFLCPSMGRARNIGFYALFSKIFCFRLQIGVSYQLLKERGSKLAQIFVCGIKIDAAFGSGISAVASNWCHFDYLLTYSQWAKPFIKVFLKNIQKFCCCAGIRLLPLHLLHVWKPFCDLLTYSQWERHFLSSFQKNSAHLTHIWRPFCQPIRREFLL